MKDTNGENLLRRCKQNVCENVKLVHARMLLTGTVLRLEIGLTVPISLCGDVAKNLRSLLAHLCLILYW